MLADIELAQTLQAAREEEKVKEVPHPLDRDYQLLKCQLQLLDSEAPEYKVGQVPQRSLANSRHCPSTHLPSWCAEESLGLGLLSLCLKGPGRVLGLGHQWGFVHTSVSLGIQHLLSLQVIYTYLEQTGNTYRCPVLQHVWKVNREGEVREIPPNPLPYHYLTLKEMTLVYVPISESA